MSAISSEDEFGHEGDAYCPKCGERSQVSQPAEPDVGIFGDLYECHEHGEWYLDDNDQAVFP
jgi:hypothetical protein